MAHQICAPPWKEYNIHDLTTAPCFWFPNHNDWSMWFPIISLPPICCPNFSFMHGVAKKHITKLGCEKYFWGWGSHVKHSWGSRFFFQNMDNATKVAFNWTMEHIFLQINFEGKNFKLHLKIKINWSNCFSFQWRLFNYLLFTPIIHFATL